jgi:hypothetical protein
MPPPRLPEFGKNRVRWSPLRRIERRVDFPPPAALNVPLIQRHGEASILARFNAELRSERLKHPIGEGKICGN